MDEDAFRLDRDALGVGDAADGEGLRPLGPTYLRLRA
jgi:hypothetical protein